MHGFIERVLTPPPPPRKEIDYRIEQKEYLLQGMRVVQNTDDNRLQLFFDGKPDAATIETLKKNGFKWSPRNRAWQRQLTPNALRALWNLLPPS